MKNLWNDFQDFLESLQSNGKSLLILSIGLIVLMGIITVGVFFLSVKGSEEVMVPDVVGKEFTTACLDMESALGELLEADGRQVSEEIVNNIFAHFCVGK